MNFTLLFVALVLTHVHLVSGMHTGASTSTGKVPGCTIVEEVNELLCKNGSELYGYLKYWPEKEKKTLLIDYMEVFPGYQNNGVATILLKHLIDNVAKNLNIKKITLQVENGSQNTFALALYKRAKFEVVPSKSGLEMELNLKN